LHAPRRYTGNIGILRGTARLNDIEIPFLLGAQDVAKKGALRDLFFLLTKTEPSVVGCIALTAPPLTAHCTQ